MKSGRHHAAFRHWPLQWRGEPCQCALRSQPMARIVERSKVADAGRRAFVCHQLGNQLGRVAILLYVFIVVVLPDIREVFEEQHGEDIVLVDISRDRPAKGVAGVHTVLAFTSSWLILSFMMLSIQGVEGCARAASASHPDHFSVSVFDQSRQGLCVRPVLPHTGRHIRRCSAIGGMVIGRSSTTLRFRLRM